jgi:hypothetical protein
MHHLHYEEWNHNRIKAIIDHYGHKFFYYKKILDLGSYHGDIAAAFVRLGADVLCVDVREDNLKEINKKHKHLKTMRVDLDHDWPFIGQKFDFIFSLDLLCHLKNYERHINDICSTAENIVLETEVLDSSNSNEKLILYEDKFVKDLSMHGEGSIVSAVNVQNRISNAGGKYKRLDHNKLNTHGYLYDWKEVNLGRSASNRRMWFIMVDQLFSKLIESRENIQKIENQLNITPSISENKSPEIQQIVHPHIEQPQNNYFISKPSMVVNNSPTMQKIRLYYNACEDDNPSRKQELDFCLNKNISNSLIETIIFREKDPTFNFMFHRINELTGPDDLNIICNSDIFFDKSILLARNLQHKQIYALSSWNWYNDGNVSFSNASDNQNAWIIRGKITNILGHFPISAPNGDNKIAYEFHKGGYKVINPSKSIKSYNFNVGAVKRPLKNIEGPHVFVVPTDMPPSQFDVPTIRLFYNYYEDKHPERKKEIDFCLQKNRSNPLLDIIMVECNTVPTYGFFFDKINQITGPNDINIIANSDIFFDNTIILTSGMGHREMYALSRWEWKDETSITHRALRNSQDTWIVRGKVENVDGNIQLGRSWCDNKIAYAFNQSGYKVSNPSRSIKTYHYHNSGVRNYDERENNIIPEKYLFVEVAELP